MHKSYSRTIYILHFVPLQTIIFFLFSHAQPRFVLAHFLLFPPMRQRRIRALIQHHANSIDVVVILARALPSAVVLRPGGVPIFAPTASVWPPFLPIFIVKL